MIPEPETMDSESEDMALEEGLKRLVATDVFTRTKSVEEVLLRLSGLLIHSYMLYSV